jgi:hypothetical protein
MGPMTAPHAQLMTHAAHTPPGSAPGSVRTAYVAYWVDSPTITRPSAVPRRSQPMELSGRREATRDPVRPKPKKVENSVAEGARPARRSVRRGPTPH